jgi:predicted ATPase with chaperone activity
MSKADGLIALMRDQKHLVLLGPIGSGKIRLSKELAAFLPEPSTALRSQQLENYCKGGLWKPWIERESAVPVHPFRAPHHTVSVAGMTGTACSGCGRVRLGELMLAHGGVLLLDEIEEFSRPVLATLREPMSTHQLTLPSKYRLAHPCSFTLIGCCYNEALFAQMVPEWLKASMVAITIGDHEEGAALYEELFQSRQSMGIKNP